MDIARVTVQFQSVTEKFTPHDTIFAFTKSSDLQDSTLSSACSLHTATASIKSSNDSLRQRGLAGITEDAFESRVENDKEIGRVKDVKRSSLPRQASEESQTRRENVNDFASAIQIQHRSSSVKTQRSLHRSRTLSNTNKALPPIPGELLHEQLIPRSTPANSEYETRPSVEGRMSSQSARPSTRDLYDAYGYKQKVKLGPRPSTDSVGRSDNMERLNEFRPVATLPAGLRMPVRRVAPQKVATTRPQSQQSQRRFPEGKSIRGMHPTTPVTPIHIPDRKVAVVSNGLLTPAKTPAEPKPPKIPSITPEKKRLMKALQLRQKQMAAQKSATDLEVKEIHTNPEPSKPEIDDTILSAIVDTSSQDLGEDVVHIAFDNIGREDTANVEASPISVPEISEGPSTQASSITDDEDITVRQKQEAGAKAEASKSNDPQSLKDFANTTKDTLPPSDGSETKSRPNVTGVSGVNEAFNTDGVVTQGDTDQSSQNSINVQQSVSEERRWISPDNALSSNTIVAPVPDGRSSTIIANQDENGDVLQNLSIAPEPPSSSGKTGLSSTDRPMKTEPRINLSVETSDSVYADLPETSFIDAVQEHQADSSAYPLMYTNVESGEIVIGVDNPIVQDTQKQTSHEPQERCSSSGEATITAIDNIIPQEIPLPPIGEDEEASLSLDRRRSQETLISPPFTSMVEDSSALPRSRSRRLFHESELKLDLPIPSDAVSGRQVERSMRRRGVLNPPKGCSSPEHSDEHFLSDDSFMEELKSATVQEAKPISVSKSPIKPGFSRSESEQRLVDITKASRSVSSPLNQSSKDQDVFSQPRLPNPSTSRSFSASQSLHPESQSGPVPKKIGVSSGISQRIKALEQLSSRPTSPQSQATASITPALNSIRKTSARIPSSAPDAIPISSNNNNNRPNTAYPSPSPSPEAVKSNPSNSMSKAGYSRPESISVKATIVRDPNNQRPAMPRNLSEPQPMGLHQSPLLVEHQTMGPPPLSPLKPPRPRYANLPSGRSGSSSSIEQRSEVSPQSTRRDSFASMRSKSSRAGSEVELPRSLSDSSLNGIIASDDIREDKKDSKRSRLMKRMSSVSSMSRRSIAHAFSPGPKEAPIPERQEPIAEAPSSLMEVGDVNIQFPDTLVSPICS